MKIRRSDQSILKEINSEYSLEGLMSEAKAPIHGPLDVKSWLIRKDPDDGKDWRQEEKGMTEDGMVDVINDSMDLSLNKHWNMVKDREAWRAAVHGVPFKPKDAPKDFHNTQEWYRLKKDETSNCQF